MLLIASCDTASELQLTPNAERPHPAPIVAPPFKLAFAAAYARGVVVLPKNPLRPELLFISDVGDSVLATGPITFISRSPDVATVDSVGTITAHVMGSKGNAWAVLPVWVLDR